MDGPHSSLDAELASYSSELLGEAKLHAGLHEREGQSLTAEEKVCDHTLREAILLTSMRSSYSKGSFSKRGSSKAAILIMALGDPLELTCMGHCKIGDL